jgi:hypothetical protein
MQQVFVVVRIVHHKHPVRIHSVASKICNKHTSTQGNLVLILGSRKTLIVIALHAERRQIPWRMATVVNDKHSGQGLHSTSRTTASTLDFSKVKIDFNS